MSEPRKPADHAERKKIAGDLSTSYAVEAGAGTGKTSLLTERILSAVLSGETALGRIAAITFTDRAACELRMRLRTELEKRFASEKNPRIAQALSEIDSAHVSTIHSFCSELLRDRAVEAGIDPGFSVGNKVQTEILFDDEWRKWLEAELGRDESPAQIALFAGITADGLKALACVLLRNKDLAICGGEPVDVSLLRKTAEKFSAGARELAEGVQKKCTSADCACLKHIYEAADAASLFDDGDDCLLLATAARLEEIKYKKPARACREHKEKCTEALGQLETLAAQMRAKAGHAIIEQLATLLQPFLAQYELAKKKISLLDFDDLLVKTRDMLRDNPEVREYFQRKFDFIFIDECQDTDPLQLEIALYLAENGAKAQSWRDAIPMPGKLLLVGDPKQSIYRFRRADIEMYEDAKEILHRHGQKIEITENFRSAPACVRWVNTVFSELIARPGDGGSYQPDYIPLNAHRQGGGKGVLVLKSQNDFKIIADARAAEAAAVAETIQKLVADEMPVFDKALGRARPVRYGDFAALFRTRASFPFYEAALAAKGIPFRAVSGREYFLRQEICEVIAVLRAIERPYDGVAVVAALRTSLLGASDAELANAARHKFDYLKEIPASSPVRAQFEQLRRWHELRGAAGISNITHDVVSATKAIELSLLRPDGEQRAANLMKIFDLARTFEDTPGATFGGFIEWIQEQTTAAEEEDSPLADDAECVKLLTIHKAKGLEFPAVILADLAGAKVEHAISVVDRRQGLLHVRMNDIETEGFGEAKDFEKLRGDAEAKRLLYVAATRARDKIILPVFPVDKKMYLLDFLLGLPDDVQAKADEFCETIEVPATEGRRFPAAFKLEIPDEPGDVSREISARDEWIARREKLRAMPAGHPGVLTPSSLHADSDEEHEPFAGQSKAAAIGSAVHATLEQVDLLTGKDVAKIAQAEAAACEIPGEAALVEQLAKNALELPMIRRAAAAKQIYREVPFTVKLGSKIVDGVIDLAFDDGRGLVIVDYKTDNVAADALAAHSKKYHLQVGAYALAAEKIFGKPPVEAALLFLRSGKEVNIPVDSKLLDSARNACG